MEYATPGPRDDEDVLQAVIAALRPLSPESKSRVIGTVSTFYGLGARPIEPAGPATARSAPAADAEGAGVSPKQFVAEKEPRTDVERVACLAYYLTHYADLPHFKTVDISRLNTEAAQPKFANAAASVNNAGKMGYLVAATKGEKQLSAAGERFVLALPDRERAKAAMENGRPRRRGRKGRKGR